MRVRLDLNAKAQMPRRARIHLDGIPLHIVQRGHNREPCFFAEDDYSSYLHWLNEALAETDCALHAYVLMTNQPCGHVRVGGLESGRMIGWTKGGGGCRLA